MPIHTSWKGFAKGLAKSYCKGASGKKKCRDFTDGSSVCMCQKGWSVFFAKVNKLKTSESKPMPKQFNEATLQWYIKKVKLDAQKM